MSTLREYMIINGKDAESVSGEWMQVENPSHRGTVFAEVPKANEEDVNIAVAAAKKAFETWKDVPPVKRGAMLYQIAAAIEAEAKELGRLVSQENGHAWKYTIGEAMNAAEKIRYYAGLATELKGSVYPSPNGSFLYSMRVPIGVVAAITPWNSPLGLAAAKIGPALLTGNTVVLKVPSTAPVGAINMVRIANRFLPAGVLNIITGPGSSTGMALARHHDVGKITFTGSTNVGTQLLHAAADRIALSTMELGGKNPQIVFPDAVEDFDFVVDAVIMSTQVRKMGQSCGSGSRIYVHRSIYDRFVEKMAERIQLLKLGEALDESTDIGPIVNEAQFKKVCSFIEQAMAEENTKLVCGGLPPKDGPLTEGWFVQPTIFTSPDNNTVLARQEIFGPVFVVIPWDDDDEVIEKANDTDYGLVAYIFCKDNARAMRTAHRINAGSLVVNFPGPPAEGHPYGGVKQSGIGREHCLEGILENYTDIKAIAVNLNYPPKR